MIAELANHRPRHHPLLEALNVLKFLPASILAVLLACSSAHASPLSTAAGTFATDFSHVAPGTPDGLWDPGTYSEVTEIGNMHSLWADATLPSGNPFLAFNALDDRTDQTAWRVTATVEPFTRYVLSAFVANLCCDPDLGLPAALLSFVIGGTSHEVTTDGPGTFLPVSIWFDTGDQTSIDIALMNARQVFGGADFAFGDPNLDLAATPEPPGALLLLSGFLLAGAFALRRGGFARPSL